MDSSGGMTGPMAARIMRDAEESIALIRMISDFWLRKAQSSSSWKPRGGTIESENNKLTRAIKDDKPFDYTPLGENITECPAIFLRAPIEIDDPRDSFSEIPPLLPLTILRSSNGGHRNGLPSLDGKKEQLKTPPTSPPRDPIPESFDELSGPHTSFSSSDGASRMDCDTGAADAITGEPSTYPTSPDTAIREDLCNSPEYNGSSAYISPPRSVGSPRVALSTALLDNVVKSISCPSIPESKTKTYTPAFRTSDIIKVISRPTFPIRVRNEIPLAFSPKAQHRKMKWTHDRHHFTPDACWVVEPDMEDVKETAWPWLEYLGSEKDSVSISFMAEGGFNKVYAIETRDRATKQKKHYVFRVTLPIDPYYKTECDVATTEIVRCSTNISVPKIYAFDSSMKNKLGLEWILMERIMGSKMSDSWVDLDYHRKMELTRAVADWNKQLAAIRSEKIGGIYMHYTEGQLQFYVGRSVHHLLTHDGRLLYNIYRGPFDSLHDFYDAVLAITEFEVETLKMKVSLRMNDSKQPLLQRRWVLPPGHEDEDWEDENWQEFQLKELDHLRAGIEALRENLPALWDSTEDASNELSTILSHHDISLRNILVNDGCEPLALLDWENIQLEPSILIQQIPDFLQSYEREDAPYPGPDLYKLAETQDWSPEVLEESVLDANKRWREKMEEYTLTKLRAVYLKEFENSDSPLARAALENHNDYDYQLCEHIMNLWVEDDCTNVKWVDYQFEEEDEEEEKVVVEQDKGMGREEGMELDPMTENNPSKGQDSEVAEGYDKGNDGTKPTQGEQKRMKGKRKENITDDDKRDEVMTEVNHGDGSYVEKEGSESGRCKFPEVRVH